MKKIRYVAWIIFIIIFLIMCFGTLRSGDDYMVVIIPLLLAIPFLSETRLSALLLGFFVALVGGGLTTLYAVRLTGTVASEGPVKYFVFDLFEALIVAVFALGMKWLHLILLRKWPSFCIPHTADQIGKFKAAWKTLIGGIAFPTKVLKISDSDPKGSSFFFYSFSICCCVPVCILNLFIILLNIIIPQVFRFQDYNPYTVIIAAPLQFLVGPMFISIFAYTFKVVNRSIPSMNEQLLSKVAWYIFTFFIVLVLWWLGILIPLYSIEFVGYDLDPDGIAPLLTLIFAAVLWVRIAVLCMKYSLDISFGKALLRLLASYAFFLVFAVPIVLVIQLMLAAVLQEIL